MTMDHNDIFSDTLANPAAKTPAHGGANLARDETSIVTEFEKAAATALTSVETYIRENPITAAVGIGAAGTLVALAIASRRSKTEPLDRRLRNELNRHSADVVRAMRRNANSIAHSDTASAVETFLQQVAGKLAKMPETVSKQVSDLAK